LKLKRFGTTQEKRKVVTRLFRKGINEFS